jgi:hypothetical protein
VANVAREQAILVKNMMVDAGMEMMKINRVVMVSCLSGRFVLGGDIFDKLYNCFNGIQVGNHAAI